MTQRLLLLFFSWVLLFSMTVQANASEIWLQVKPENCVVKSAKLPCETNVNVSWQSSAPVSVCLYQDATKIKCWNQQTKGTFVKEVSFQQAIQFSLKDKSTLLANGQLVKTTLKPKKRRRQSAFWSIL